MVVSSKCAEPRPKKTDARTQFAFLGRSAAGRRMTAENKLEQLHGSGHSNMLALRRTSSWTSAPPSCMSLDAWLAASGATWEVVWRRFNLPAGRRPWLGCSSFGIHGIFQRKAVLPNDLHFQTKFLFLRFFLTFVLTFLRYVTFLHSRHPLKNLLTDGTAWINSHWMWTRWIVLGTTYSDWGKLGWVFRGLMSD